MDKVEWPDFVELKVLMKYKHEITKASFRARSKLFEQLYMEKQRLLLSMGRCQEEELQTLYDEVKNLRNEFAETIKVEDTNADYLFVTINPSPDVTYDQFSNAIDKLLKKKWLQRYIYVIEQRGKTEEEMGIGFHFHMLLDRRGKPEYDCKREIANTVQYITNVELGRKNSWTKMGPFMCEKTMNNLYKNRLTYMLTQKQTINKETGEYNYKDVKQHIDKIWRIKMQLSPYYIKGQWDLEDILPSPEN